MVRQCRPNLNYRMMLSIKDPFTFEFLGLDAREAVSESDLEQALMDHLQEFMLELPDKKKLEEFMLKEIEEMGM